jgi:hypothetical protein
MFCRGFFCVALISAVWNAPSKCQCIPATARAETFSTVKEVAGQGFAGSELYLEETGTRVEAVLRDYLGNINAEETKLNGILQESKIAGQAGTACEVNLSGRGLRGGVSINGEITPRFFKGTVTRHLGRDVFSHQISLKRQLAQENWDGLAFGAAE